ncbi:large subunit ribosomal protein L18Ae [Pancytospora philotis]|nr:large subunit ribosomal protein L18Ae [Pancytospora philotis]
MQFSKVNYAATPIKEFRVHGCKTPSESVPQPQIFASTIFAIDSVYAQSKFLKLLNKQHGIKSTAATILRVEEVEQDNDFELKNYGIRFTYKTRSGLQNAYKEIRHINRALAVADLMQEFGSRHKVRAGLIYIISVEQLADEAVTKTKVLSYIGKDVMFPVFLKVPNTETDIVPETTKIFN